MSKSQTHQRFAPGGLLLALLFAAVTWGSHANAAPSTAIDATILPKRFVRQFDPLTVVFQSPVGPSTTPKAAHDGERWLKLVPKPNGTYRWLDRRTLEFRPVTPWPAYQRIQASVPAQAPNATKTPLVAKTITLSTLLPSPQSVSPKDGAQDQRNVSQVALEFGQAVPVAALRKALHIEILTLPGVGNTNQRRTLAPSQWWLKRVAKVAKTSTYNIHFRRPLPKASTIRLRLRLTLPAVGANKQLQQPIWTSHFRTMRPFYLLGVKCNSRAMQLGWGRSRTAKARALDCGGGAAVPTLIFSRPIGKKTNPGSLRELLRISPQVPGLKLEVQGNKVQIKGHYRRDALYRITIEGGTLPIYDNAHQRLRHQGRQTLYFFLGQKRPFLKWRVGRGLLERHGPQMMPLHSRSIPRVDLRIHPIKATDRNYWPYPTKAIAINENQAPPKAGTVPTKPTTPNPEIGKRSTAKTTKSCYGRNCRVAKNLWKLTLTKHIKLLGTPVFSGIINMPLDPSGHGHKVGLDLRTQLKQMLPWNKASGKVALAQSNQFLVGLRTLNASTQRRYVRIQVTDLALTTIEERSAVQFAVTSISNGKPVIGASVLVEGPQHRRDTKWRVLWRGTTNDKGLVRLSLKAKRKGHPLRLRVVKGKDTLVLNPLQPPPAFVNNHWSPVTQAWLGWTQEHVTHPVAPSVLGHLYTERPVYRPGEPVHIKGIVRSKVAGKLALPTKKGMSIRLDIKGPKQQRWLFDDVKLSKSGGLYRKFVPNGAPTGAYVAHLIWMRNDGRTRKLATRKFRIEAYKLPLFEVLIHAPRKVPADKPFQIAATGRYYAGGLVVSQPIKWRVTERVVTYRPKGRKGFHFASSIRYSRRNLRRRKLLVQKSGSLSPNGQAALKLDPTKSFDLRARRYTVEAVIKGPDGRDVTGYKHIKVLPPFSIGVKLENRFRRKPGPITADLIAVGVKGGLQVGVPLKVQLLRREWHAQLVQTDFVQGRTRYRTEVVDRPIKACTITTKKSAVQCALTAKAGGVYILQVTARDKMGRLQRVSLDMYVQGKQAIAWERTRNSTFKLSLSKKKYRANQSATVLVRSPFQSARGLAIIEDPAGVEYRWIDIVKGKGVLTVPLAQRHTPSLYVHVVLMRGRVAAPLTKGLDPGKPKTSVASIQIPVDPRANRVMVAMKWPKQARPRQWVEGQIHLKTPDGKPLSGEVTLWAVDRAALSLGREARIHPLRAFVHNRGTALRIRDTRNLVIGRVPRIADRPGGGGGALGGRMQMVRKNFRTVPYYNPAIQVGPSGIVKVRFQLPDDLTTFAIRAVAVSGAERFGYVEKHLLVQLPVMVQRALPRFVRPGDQLLSGGFARIVSGPAGKATAQITTTGLQTLTSSTRDFMLHKRAAVPVFFAMFLPRTYRKDVSVQLQVRRHKDNETDAFKVKLPVKQDRNRVYFLQEQQVASLANAVDLLKKWPEKIRPGSGRVEVLLASSDAIVRTVGAMEYLLEYPYGCIEQRVSRANPLLALESIHRQFALRHLSSGRTRNAVKATLKQIQGTVQRDGTIGYWPGSSRSLWLTAYATAFVVKARRAGYSYPSKQLTHSLNALRKALRSDIGLGNSRWQLATRAEILWTLAQAAQHQPAYLRRLYAKRKRLDLYGRSRLLLAMQRDRARHISRIQSLTRSLRRQVRISQQGGKAVLRNIVFTRRGYWHGVLLSSRTRTAAALLEALAVTAPGTAQVTALKDALLSAASTKRLGFGWQNNGYAWGNTQNNAAALLALGSFLKNRVSTSKERRFAYQLQRKGQKGWSAAAKLSGKAAWHFTTKSDVPLQLKLTSSLPGKPVWIRARISYVPLKSGAKLPTRNAGISVSRMTQVVQKSSRFIALKTGKAITVPHGALLEEEIKVVVGKRRYHVVVEVPIAAGLTLLNPALKTASSEARPSQAHSLKPSHIAYLDDRVQLFFDRMPAGVHKLYFRARAVTAGRFTYPPARASLMYQPSIFGRGPGYTLAISPPKKP